MDVEGISSLVSDFSTSHLYHVGQLALLSCRIVPIIGASLYLPGIYLLFQSILLYLAMSYPRDAASIFAVNDLFRSTVAAFFPLVLFRFQVIIEGAERQK